MGKAVYGALMGLGQGISQYGNALSADALSDRNDERMFTRQQSLEDIRQRFQFEFRQEERTFQEDVRDEKRDYDEGREMDLLDPGSDLYKSREAERKRLADEEQANKEALRKIPYGGSGGVLSNLNQSQWTPKSWRALMTEINRVQSVERLTIDEAYQIASAKIPLVPKPGASSSDTANTNKIINESVDVFSEQFKDSMILELQEWFPGEDLSRLTKLQLVEKFKELKRLQLSPSGLMNQAQFAAPGSSQANPVDVRTTNTPPPPGTWVRLPDGRIVQMP